MARKRPTLMELKRKKRELSKQLLEAKKRVILTIGENFLNFLEKDMEGFSLDKFVEECQKMIGYENPKRDLRLNLEL